MEHLKLKYDQTQKALTSITVLQKEQEALGTVSSNLELALRDSFIKRFEYSIDTLWKYLKLYLQVKHGSEQKSPKTVFKECFRVGIIDEEETKLSLEMVDDRNMTTHTYNENVAQEIFDLIPKYHELMQSILKKASP